MKSRTMFNSKKLTVGLLIIYLAVLTWIIVFKMEFDLSLLSRMNLRSINLIPFAESASVNGRVDTSEILLNMVAFYSFWCLSFYNQAEMEFHTESTTDFFSNSFI